MKGNSNPLCSHLVEIKQILTMNSGRGGGGGVVWSDTTFLKFPFIINTLKSPEPGDGSKKD